MQKSIIGNTCDKIFTDIEISVHVHPMQYKSQAGEAFNEVTRDIEVPNTLISDNAGKIRYHRNKYVAVALMLGKQNHALLGRTDPKGW